LELAFAQGRVPGRGGRPARSPDRFPFGKM